MKVLFEWLKRNGNTGSNTCGGAYIQPLHSKSCQAITNQSMKKRNGKHIMAPNFKKEEVARSARAKEDLWFLQHEAELLQAAQDRQARQSKNGQEQFNRVETK